MHLVEACPVPTPADSERLLADLWQLTAGRGLGLFLLGLGERVMLGVQSPHPGVEEAAASLIADQCGGAIEAGWMVPEMVDLAMDVAAVNLVPTNRRLVLESRTFGWQRSDPLRGTYLALANPPANTLTGAAALLGGLVAWAGGVPGVGATRLLLPNRLPRSSRWATWRDLRPLQVRRARRGSMVLGRRGPHLIATEPETSVLVIGPTRSGKTSGLVVPNLLDWDGPAIVTSTKSELVDLTARHRATLGPVSIYDPTGEIGDPHRTVTWSPLTGCGDLDVAWTVAAWLCAGLQQGASRGDSDWAHWAESGKLLIAPLLFAAASSDRSIIDVRDWIHGFDLEEPMAILQELADAHRGPDSDSDRAIGMLTSIDQRPEKERGTVFSTVMRIFSVFNERSVAVSAMTSEFDPERLLRTRGTLFLCTPRQSPERVASLFVGILMTVVTSAYRLAATEPGGRLHAELGLFLDELANVVPIDELPALASQGAGRGVLLMSIVQDFSQLRARYGPDRANSILNNHGCKMVLPGISDPETTDVVAKLVGRSDFTDVQVSHNDGRASRSYALRQDQMATPDALRQLQEGTGIVLYRGKPPTIVRLRPWYTDRRLADLVRRPMQVN